MADTTRTRRTAENFEEDPRYRVAVREMVIALAYWLAFTIVVTGSAWLLGGGKSADELDFVLGFPTWFFWSVLVASVAFSVIPYFLVKHSFTDMPLDAGHHEDDEAGPGDGDTPVEGR